MSEKRTALPFDALTLHSPASRGVSKTVSPASRRVQTAFFILTHPLYVVRLPRTPASMSYDLKAFCRDLQDRLNWLFKEVTRLQEENERLLQENKDLREEATVSRLFREMGEKEPVVPPRPDLPPAPPSDLPREATDFFRALPDTFTFADYFQAADAYGVAPNNARDWMLLFFRENMLEQRGKTIEKNADRPYQVRLVR